MLTGILVGENTGIPIWLGAGLHTKPGRQHTFLPERSCIEPMGVLNQKAGAQQRVLAIQLTDTQPIQEQQEIAEAGQPDRYRKSRASAQAYLSTPRSQRSQFPLSTPSTSA